MYTRDSGFAAHGTVTVSLCAMNILYKLAFTTPPLVFFPLDTIDLCTIYDKPTIVYVQKSNTKVIVRYYVTSLPVCLGKKVKDCFMFSARSAR